VLFKKFFGGVEDFGDGKGKSRYIILKAEAEPGPRSLIL